MAAYRTNKGEIIGEAETGELHYLRQRHERSEPSLATKAGPSRASEGGATDPPGSSGERGDLGEGVEIELFEAKEKVRKLETEVEIWKERYRSASGLVAFYEHGCSFN